MAEFVLLAELTPAVVAIQTATGTVIAPAAIRFNLICSVHPSSVATIRSGVPQVALLPRIPSAHGADSRAPILTIRVGRRVLRKQGSAESHVTARRRVAGS